MNDGDWIWSASQRRALLLVLVLLLAVMAYRAWRYTLYVPPIPTSPGPLADELSGAIDPNLADVGQLSALPEMGLKRAEAIVAYRTEYQRRHPGQVAFRTAGDLARVNGIGPATAEGLAPYWEFAGKTGP
ncbi:MAG TPA: helix-hairpin-helix domain-containing protein [Tepidisphaeraceae bacterium]|nr:helix-hairpin-helix domain-containing protein [Tepidisphaeraceae bacterium]